MARHRKPDVPPHEPIKSRRDISPSPRHAIEGELIDDDATRELPAVRAPRRAPARRPRGKKYAPRLYESKGRKTRREIGQAVGHQASRAADRAALSRAAAGRKPSVVGHAGKGALAGAAAGAEIGSVVPGVGTAIGAGAGAAVGGAAGAAGGAKAKREWRAAMRADTAVPRKILVAEFVICALVVVFAPMSKTQDDPRRWMRQMTALFLLFAGLGAVTAAGKGAAKVSAAFGGVITLSMLLGQANFITRIAGIFGGTTGNVVSVEKIPADGSSSTSSGNVNSRGQRP